MFGPTQPVVLHLLDIAPMLEGLNGVVMELDACSLPLLAGVVATSDVKEAFSGIDYAILVGAMPRREGMERADLLKANAKIFKEQGTALNEHSKKTVKVLVVGNPANTNALLALLSAPTIPKENFSCLTRLDHNRAKSQIATRLRVGVEKVNNVIIWGNHSSTQYPDVSYGVVHDYPQSGSRTSVHAAVNDESWLQADFIKTVQQRGAAVIKARKLSSAASAAKAIVDHMHDWLFGTKEGEYISMGVYSDGSYDIKQGIIYSFPVTVKDGRYHIVQGLPVSEFSRKKMKETEDELVSEKEQAVSFLSS